MLYLYINKYGMYVHIRKKNRMYIPENQKETWATRECGESAVELTTRSERLRKHSGLYQTHHHNFNYIHIYNIYSILYSYKIPTIW